MAFDLERAADEALGQIAPRDAGPKPEENGFDEQAIVRTQNILCFGSGGDSRISKSLTREWSARGGADRCDDMHCATTSGIGSKTFCRAVKAMWGARRRLQVALTLRQCTTRARVIPATQKRASGEMAHANAPDS